MPILRKKDQQLKLAQPLVDRQKFQDYLADQILTTWIRNKGEFGWPSWLGASL